MFVVNTTSATLGASPPRRLPRKRVPSSRRRNPERPRRSVTGRYGFFVAGGGVAGGVVPPVAGAGAAPVGAGVAGARPGTAVVGLAPGAGAELAGAFTGAGANV